MRKVAIFLLQLLPLFVFGQNLKGYEIEVLNPVTEVKNQYFTGTCWAYATTSFIEAEFLRKTGEKIDLAEMFSVYWTYIMKAEIYVRMHGNNTFAQGGLGHDVLNVIKKYGIIPESAYSKVLKRDAEMFAELKNYLDSVVALQVISQDWEKGYVKILQKYLPEPPKQFDYAGKTYNPKSFAYNYLKIDPQDYSEFTSFTHKNYYEKIILEIPDNWARGMYWNVPVRYLYELTKESLENGYTVLWDADVSEPGFNQRAGLATLTKEQKKELNRDGYQIYRQKTFETYRTTDDHLMHIVGLAKKDKKEFFIVKNSWGPVGPANGYIYVSKDYFLTKTISILVNNEIIPEELKERLYNETEDEDKD